VTAALVAGCASKSHYSAPEPAPRREVPARPPEPPPLPRETPPPTSENPAFGEYIYVEELPEALTRVLPEYPAEARAAGVTGTVLLQALVGKDGLVKDVKIVRSIPPLDGAAEDAVRRWVFKPAMAKQVPVAVWVAIPIKFPPGGTP
jgi:protein TonB